MSVNEILLCMYIEVGLTRLSHTVVTGLSGVRGKQREVTSTVLPTPDLACVERERQHIKNIFVW